MPIDRKHTNHGRPLMPTLATTRTATTPIAPRLAPSAASSNASQSARTPRSNAGNTPRGTTASQEDLSTPVKSFLNNNITPRSSSRKSRVGVGSTQSTPTTTPSGTPSSTRPSSTIDFPSKEHGHGHGGIGPNGLGAHSSSRPRSGVGGTNSYNTTPTPRPPIANVYNHAASEVGGARAASPMFFHANDARTHEPLPPSKKAPTFFYADGKQDDNARPLQIPSPPLSSVGRPQTENKFFHVDSISETMSPSPILTPPPINASLEPWTSTNTTQKSPSLQPPSPSKENIHLSYRKGASQVIRPNLHTRPSPLSIVPGQVGQSHGNDAPQDRTRKSSIASTAARLGHSKSASLSSIDSVTSPKHVPSNDLPHIAPSPLHIQKRASSNGSLPESVASEPVPAGESLSGLSSPNPLSPTQPGGGKSVLERMNELAANARRERKVLDLEISNSSLLAINRQLEKEVRKQKAELRRFRRMSRAGRFSMDTVSSTLENFSAVGGGGDIGTLSDMSEEEEGNLEGDDPESSSESSFDEGTMSPDTLAERDAAHRLRDEKRLQLDLTKHRELLIDSQKMNQSLKRCLNWTEELIKDAQKALAYQVRASDVKLGGRVLNTEEHQDEGAAEDSRALLSPWTPHSIANPLEQVPLTDAERTDRDSGVDLDGLKPTPLVLPSNMSPPHSLLADTPSRPPQTPLGMEETY